MTRIVKSESLHMQTYHIMKNSILEGEYKPDERLVEAKIAENIGVSRGTVREAIRMLVQDGLLIYNEGQVRVYNPAVEDIVEIFQCRESLEELAVRLAVKNISTEELNGLDENIQKVKEKVNHNSNAELGELDQEFHNTVIASSKNKQLIELMDTIKTKIMYMRNTMTGNDYLPPFINDHERIYNALWNRNEEEAVDEMRAHINRGLDGVLSHINNKLS
ncbi:GntR family transcriptional regulator [Salibacterium sp. K-3]